MLLTKEFGFLFLVLVLVSFYPINVSKVANQLFPTLFFRLSLWGHSPRPELNEVSWIAEEQAPKYPKPDPNFVTWEAWNFIKWNPTQTRIFRSGFFFSGFLGFEDHVAHPTNSQKGVKIFLNSRRASPNVEKNPGNRRWQMYILRNGCEPGKSKRICDPTGISPNFLTLHSFSWKWQHCVLSFCWADTGFKVYRLNRFGLNSYLFSTSCHMRLTSSKWIFSTKFTNLSARNVNTGFSSFMVILRNLIFFLVLSTYYWNEN